MNLDKIQSVPMQDLQIKKKKQVKQLQSRVKIRRTHKKHQQWLIETNKKFEESLTQNFAQLNLIGESQLVDSHQMNIYCEMKQVQELCEAQQNQPNPQYHSFVGEIMSSIKQYKEDEALFDYYF